SPRLRARRCAGARCPLYARLCLASLIPLVQSAMPRRNAPERSRRVSRSARGDPLRNGACTSLPPHHRQGGTMSQRKVAVLIGPDFEDSELTQPVKALRDAGHHVELLGREAGETL